MPYKSKSKSRRSRCRSRSKSSKTRSKRGGIWPFDPKTEKPQSNEEPQPQSSWWPFGKKNEPSNVSLPSPPSIPEGQPPLIPGRPQSSSQETPSSTGLFGSLFSSKQPVVAEPVAAAAAGGRRRRRK